ncbi:MAG: ATP-binding protein [Bacteroidales bacterium]
MIQFNYKITSIDNLTDILKSKDLRKVKVYKSLLVQIYSAQNTTQWYQLLGNSIKKAFPKAIIIGASSVGEISNGRMFTSSTVISFTFFKTTSLKQLTYECINGEEDELSQTIVTNVNSLPTAVKGLLMLTTPSKIDSTILFNRISEQSTGYPIFGGIAADSSYKPRAIIFDGSICYDQGVIAVAFCGDIQIEPYTYLGWIPLSKEMTITKTEGMVVKTIDNQPAFWVYERYLGLKIDDDFFRNAQAFPFLLNRNGQTIARVPFNVSKKDGSIEFHADIKEGETFRIGYGSPATILDESAHIQDRIQEFQPEAIFLYSCICRRYLMQHDVELETIPFNKIAPTSGFYTFGEFYSKDCNRSLLNSSMVAVGLRENTSKDNALNIETALPHYNQYKASLYQHQHSQIISKLVSFISSTTQELEEQNKQLKQLIEQKNQFLGMVVHDLRNPIGIIQGFSELLENKVDNENKEYTQIISHVTADMLSMINDFLDISKIEAGKLELHKTEIDYIQFINDNIVMNRMLANNKEIAIATDIQIEKQTITLDDKTITQVLNNLIGNAVKYSNRNSTITIKVFKDANHIVTQIIDQGVGIPNNEIKHIFKPFSRTSISPTEGESSHGLGLTIVKKIIEQHSGTIHVSSTLGKGSVFTFSLPIEQ